MGRTSGRVVTDWSMLVVWRSLIKGTQRATCEIPDCSRWVGVG